MAENKKGMFGFAPIVTRQDAEKAIKESSYSFLGLAVFQSILGYFIVGFYAFVDGFLFAFLALWLLKRKSKNAAVILLIISVINVFSTFFNRINNAPGGRNIFLTIIMLFVAYRAVKATFRFTKK